MTRPLLVNEGRPRARDAVIAFALGALASSAILGFLLGLVGAMIPPLAPLAFGVVVAVAAAVLGLADFGRAGLRTPTLRRQTRAHWFWRFGTTRASFLWGLDLGAGITTIRVASLYWVVLLVVVLIGTPLTGALVLASYGIALGAHIAIATFAISPTVRLNKIALHTTEPIRYALGGILLLWSVFLISQYAAV